MTVSILAKLPHTDSALLVDAATAVMDGNPDSMTYLVEQASGANLGTVKTLAATHGAEYDGYGTDGIFIDVFIYTSTMDKANALVAALKEAGIESRARELPEDDD